MDAVYIVGPQARNEELRYSLRSLRNLPHDRVWIVGHQLPWLTNVEQIPTSQFPSGGGRKYQNGIANIRAACTQDGMSDDIILMNDDFFVMEPLGSVPVLHQGPLADRVRVWRTKSVAASYPRGGASTADLLLLLSRMTGRDPLKLVDYELHVPMVVNRLKFIELVDAAATVVRVLPVHRRTLYGNVMQLGGEQMPDVKVFGQGRLPSGPFASTNNASFNTGMAGKQIREAFPDPGPYEQ